MELLDGLAGAYRFGGWSNLYGTAVAKYATPAAESRVKAIYEAHPEQCPPELLAYFIRVDPDYADRIFHSHAWEMHAPPGRCTLQYFARTMPLAMDRVLEEYVAAYLMHGTVFVKTEAARTLELYGSKGALAPLWDAFRYFHEYWKGQRDELARNGEGSRPELVQRHAIAHGKNWRLSGEDLPALEALCISRQCVLETQQDRRSLQQR